MGELGGSASSVPGVVTSGANHPSVPQYYPGTQGYDHPGMVGGSGSGMSSMASHHLSERYLNTANQLNGDRYMNGTLSSRHTSLQGELFIQIQVYLFGYNTVKIMVLVNRSYNYLN